CFWKKVEARARVALVFDPPIPGRDLVCRWQAPITMTGKRLSVQGLEELCENRTIRVPGRPCAPGISVTLVVDAAVVALLFPDQTGRRVADGAVPVVHEARGQLLTAHGPNVVRPELAEPDAPGDAEVHRLRVHRVLEVCCGRPIDGAGRPVRRGGVPLEGSD